MVSTQTAYVDKTKINETEDLWHTRLGHVSYHKLKVMMKESMLRVFVNSMFERIWYVLHVESTSIDI